jgi:hypothetical protein
MSCARFEWVCECVEKRLFNLLHALTAAAFGHTHAGIMCTTTAVYDAQLSRARQQLTARALRGQQQALQALNKDIQAGAALAPAADAKSKHFVGVCSQCARWPPPARLLLQRL